VRIVTRYAILFGLALACSGQPQVTHRGSDPLYHDHIGDLPQYRDIQRQLAQGWNTWDSRSVLRYVLLPEGFAINLGLKQHSWLEEQYLDEALIGRSGEGAEQIRPGMRTYDGSYLELEIEWQSFHARIQAGTDGMDDLVVLVTPLAEPEAPVSLVVESAMLWNGSGALFPVADEVVGMLTNRRVTVRTTADTHYDPYVPTSTPYLVVGTTEPVGIYTGAVRTVDDISAILTARRQELLDEAAQFGDLAEAFLAIQSGVAWNTIYEPRYGRVISTIGRLWNAEYGGYAMFGWDNFFLAYLTSLASRDLAYANVIEQLRGATEEGFFPNDNRGNRTKSFDRSQPPVGGIMVREVYRRYPEPWFLETVFDPLLKANRWWPTKRLNGTLLSYGTHEAMNPLNEPAVRTKRTAGYESGMDDSPMYEDVPFNPDKNTLELQDVGLTSLYIADALALAELAAILGRTAEEVELRERAQLFADGLETVWDERAGYYFNWRTDLDRPSPRRSPTLFYPMLARVPSEERAQRMVNDHLLNPEEFWGEFVIPSTTRDDPSFPRQRYWKGAIWPPLNFLTYLGLRTYALTEPAAELSRKSLDMFLAEWRRKGYVSENYSSITGAGDDRRLSSDPFHSWGALFGIMAFMEAGHLAPFEAALDGAAQ